MSPFKTILSFIVIASLGFALIPQIPIDLFPRAAEPVLTVSFSMKDAPPEVIEQEATSPLENALSQLTHLKRIYSVSKHGSGSVELRFDSHTNLDMKKFEASSIIRHLYRNINHDVSYPEIRNQSQGDKVRSPLLAYRINARLAPFQIRKTIEDIFLPHLSQQSGVSEVNVRGAEELQLSISYDHEKLRQFGIKSDDIARQIQTEYSAFFPGALLTSNTERFMIKGGRSLENPTDLEEVMIRADNGHRYPLKKLASIHLEESRPTRYFRVNGLSSIMITVHADEGVNRLELGNKLKHKMNELTAVLPLGFTALLDYDDTDLLQQEINKNIFRSCLSFFILLIFLIVSYRSRRHVIVLFSGILISLGLLSFIVFFIGLQIHLYTIAGITVALGIVIDNSIVVLDHLRKGKDKKIFPAVLGGAVTTITALMLVFFLPEEDRQNLGDFCIVVSLAIGCSVFTAMFYSPAANVMFPSSGTGRERLSFTNHRRTAQWLNYYSLCIEWITTYRKTFITICILAFGLPVFLLPPTWEGHEFYNRTIGSNVYQMSIRPVTDKVFGGALRLFVHNVNERGGYREVRHTQLLVHAELPHGHTLESMNHIMQGLEHYLNTVDGVKKYITQVYSGQHAMIVITFKPEEENSSLPFVLKNQLIAFSQNWAGVQWNIYGVGQSFNNASWDNTPTFNVTLKGYNYHVLASYAEVLAKKLLAHKRIQKVNTNERLDWADRSSEHLTLNLAGSWNTSPTQLASELHERAESVSPSFYLTLKGDLYPIYLKANQGSLSKYDAMQIPLMATDSQFVKLSTMATIATVRTTNAIHKENRNYIRVVGFEYFGNYQFGNEHLDRVLNELESELPPGYSAVKHSFAWDWKQVKRQYSLIALLAVGIYFIAAVLFENLRQPLYVVFLIPLSFIGLFLTFALFDLYFDQGGYAAFILLGGLVVNASLYIVNDFNNAGRGQRVLIRAVVGKMKPILLAILSTCLGLLPFIIAGQKEVFWFALAAGTTGGLVFSAFVLFVVLPVVLSEKKMNAPRSAGIGE